MKVLNDKQRKAIHAKIKGHGYFVQYRHSLKNPRDKHRPFGKLISTKSFITEKEAIKHARQFQDGDSIVNILDGTNMIAIKKVGSINLSGKFSEGV